MAFYMKGFPFAQSKLERKTKKARKTLKQIEGMQDKRQTKTRFNSKVSRIDDEGVKTNKEKRKQKKLVKTVNQAAALQDKTTKQRSENYARKTINNIMGANPTILQPRRQKGFQGPN